MTEFYLVPSMYSDIYFINAFLYTQRFAPVGFSCYKNTMKYKYNTGIIVTEFLPQIIISSALQDLSILIIW